MARDKPDYYDDLAATLDQIWSLWTRGANDRHCAFHSPTFITNTKRWPAARTVILRDADRDSRTLTVHSDARARKVSQVDRDPRATLHVWDSKRSIQVRSHAQVSFASDEKSDEEWDALSPRSQALYGIEPAPATCLETPPRQPEDVAPSARSNFVVLTAELVQLEWLFLFHAGHRRALFEWEEQRWKAHWLVP